MIKCVIIDDEPLARECLKGYVDQIDFLELTGEGTNPLELSSILDKQAVDLIFLDIQMPKMNGIDFLKTSKNLPMVVFTTAYPSFALEGYELDVLDYLLKPITFSRFFQAATKSKEFFQLSNVQPSVPIKKENESGFFFIKCNTKYEKIYLNDILYIQAMQNYVMIHTQREKYMTLMNLKAVEQNLDSQTFLRVHKSYIVPIGKVDGVEDHQILIGDQRIPMSRTLRKEVLDQVLGDRLW